MNLGRGKMNFIPSRIRLFKNCNGSVGWSIDTVDASIGIVVSQG